MEREAYAAMAENEGSHWWFVGRRELLNTLIKHRVCLREGASILEAGCGTGGNLELLGKFGSVEAIEYDDAARQIAQKKSGINVKSGSLPDGIGHIEGPFDLIVLLDVLEHLERDEDSLRSLATLLAPEGRLMLTVPALQFLWSSHDEMHHHHRRYSRKTLKAVLYRSGLKIEYLSYFNILLLPAAIVQRLFARFTKAKPQIDPIPVRPVNVILREVFKSERMLLRNTSIPIGLSLCAVCPVR